MYYCCNYHCAADVADMQYRTVVRIRKVDGQIDSTHSNSHPGVESAPFPYIIYAPECRIMQGGREVYNSHR
jgi:hypothetical protein